MLSAPYQILNALEAIHHFHFSKNHLRIIDTGHFARAQFNSVIGKTSASWSSVKFCNFRYKLPYLNYHSNWPDTFWDHAMELYLLFDQCLKRQRANRFACKIGKIDNLIIGNYRRDYDMHMRHLVNRLRFNRLFVLDVGTDTFRINLDRYADENELRNETEPVPVTTGIGNIKQWIKKSFLDWDTRGVKSLTFFTTYDIEPTSDDYVIKNSYAVVKSIVVAARPSTKVFFVGQPLVDQGYITRENFANILLQIKNYFAGQNLVYVQHPRESDSQLKVIRDLEIAVESFAEPFEFSVSFSGERPQCVASFFSSVVENIATIFGDTLQLYVFRLPQGLLLKDHDSVNKIYSEFAKRKENIKVVAL